MFAAAIAHCQAQHTFSEEHALPLQMLSLQRHWSSGMGGEVVAQGALSFMRGKAICRVYLLRRSLSQAHVQPHTQNRHGC